MWVENEKHGYGTYVWSDGKEFTGEWVKGQIGSFGIYVYADGRNYEGFMVDGKRHGYGIMQMPDKNTYSGSWSNSKMHGFGCVLNAKAEQKWGIWDRGEKLIKLSQAQATDIQDGVVDMTVQPHINKKLQNPQHFWDEVSKLTNKFEPFYDFNAMQTNYELARSLQEEKEARL